MASATLVLSGLTSVLTGAAFLVVVRALARRQVSRENRVGHVALRVWWGALGAYLVLQGVLTALAAFGALDVRTYLLSRLVSIPLLCASTWGITCHLAFVHTGRARVAPALGVLYAAVGALFFYATFSSPKPLVVEDWLVRFGDDDGLMRVVYALVGLPPILAAFGYLALLPHAKDASHRYRLALTAGAILAYVGGGLVARLSGSDLVVFLTLVPLGALAAGASLLAHYPPRRLRARLGA